MFGSEVKMQIQELLGLIMSGEELCLAVNEVKSFKSDSGEVRNRVNQLLQMLKTLLYFITSNQTSPYLRPLNRISAQVKHKFELARTMVHKRRHQNLFRRLFTSRNATRFRELFHLLDASINDMELLLNVYNLQAPIRNKRFSTFLELVWSYIAAVQMGRELEDRVEAAEFLALIAQEKDEYKKVIFEEGGVPPLQKLLKGYSSTLEAQIIAANALCQLANEEERRRIIMKEMTATIIDRLSRESPMKDQIQAAILVASIAQHNPQLKEYDLIRENVMWRLVTLLSSEPSTDDARTNLQMLELKLSCSRALWKLAHGSVLNCRTLTETKGMLCLAKLVATEHGELRYNCLMIIEEITSLAESNNDFRHLAFKPASGAAKAVVDQLLRVIKEFDHTKLKITAIKSVGCLARSFSAKDTRVISPLVSRLGHADQEVAREAAIALQKFVCPKNHLSWEHSKSIIEFNGIPLLMKLLLSGHKESRPHGLALICYLAKHDTNGNVLMESGALTALQTTGRAVVAEHPELNELVSDAVSKLQVKRATHTESNSSLEGRIRRVILEQSKIVYNYLRCVSKILLEGSTGVAEKLVKPQAKSRSMVTRYKKRFSTGLRSFKTRGIRAFRRANCKDLALRWVMDYGGRRAMKEVVQKLRLMKNIFNQSMKKVIRRKFGFIIHKCCKALLM